MNKIDDLRAQLKAAEEEQKAERQRIRKATPVVMKYTMLPTKKKHLDKIYDDTIRMYDLAGKCVNKEEAEAVGHSEFETRGGSMTYFFNTGTGKIIGHASGGTIFVGNSFGREDDKSDDLAFEQIGQFLVEHPEGGDITDIVEAHKERRRGKE